MKAIYLAVCLSGGAMLISGCAASTVYRQPGAPVLAPSLPAEIRLFAAEPKAAYTVLGSVAADCLGGTGDALELLRKKAASLGANAVVSLRITKIDVGSGRTGLSGTAVRLGR